MTTDWSEPHQQLPATYRNADFIRVVTISPKRSPTKAVYSRFSFEVALESGRHGIAASSTGWQTANGIFWADRVHRA
jgi:hypothetical protein